MRLPVIFVLMLVSALACLRRENPDGDAVKEDKAAYTKYAKGFNLSDYQDFKLVEVFNPWQNSTGINFTYIVGDDPGVIPDSLKEYLFIKTPVERVITLSTTHVALITELGMAESVKGVSGTAFIYDSTIRNRIKTGEVLDVGYDQGLSYETIISLRPDVLFMYGVEGSVLGIAEKLKELGIPVVFCGEYLEKHPLGKSEWIRFFSLFYEMEEESDLFFMQIDSMYQSLAARTADLDDKPSVMLGLPWKDTWYVAGGNSFSVKLIEDAGGSYLWSENLSSEAIPLDIESVYVRALKADVWINPGAANTLEELHLFDQRFGELPVLKTGRVYNNNARMGVGGGNDYWESGTVRPDLILADLISVFHPDLLPDHQFIYYRKLK